MKNTHGYSPLHWAAYMGHIDTVKSLVNDGGADLEIGDANGATPLHWAASGGQAAVVKKLLALNANPDALDNKDASPLHWAAGEEESTPGILEVLQLLVKGGTDMDRKQRVVGSIPMCTAFELAKEKNLPLAIKTLEKLKGIWTPKSSAEKKAETDKRQAAAHERIGKARAVLEKRIQANKAAIAAKKVEARNLQRKQSKLSDEAKERQRTEAAAIAVRTPSPPLSLSVSPSSIAFAYGNVYSTSGKRLLNVVYKRSKLQRIMMRQELLLILTHTASLKRSMLNKTNKSWIA